MNWENDGYEIKNDNYEGKRVKSHNYNNEQQYKRGITWTSLSSSNLSCRFVDYGFTFDSKGPLCEVKNDELLYYVLALLSSTVTDYYLKALSPTIDFNPGQLEKIPFIRNDEYLDEITNLSQYCISLSKDDWDDNEFSWDFKKNPLIENNSNLLKHASDQYIAICKTRFNTIRETENRINIIFEGIYGLTYELSLDVADRQPSTFTYDVKKQIINLISYYVGCMFGRYSLDYIGLQFAGGDYKPKEQRFMPDLDNIIPINDNEYFSDDIVSRFVEFIRIAFGDEHLEENLKFITNNLGIKGKGTSREIIRKYFLNDFYKDHLKMYSNLPIYWLFDSGKENGFKALIYMHRYDENLSAT